MVLTWPGPGEDFKQRYLLGQDLERTPAKRTDRAVVVTTATVSEAVVNERLRYVTLPCIDEVKPAPDKCRAIRLIRHVQAGTYRVTE